MPTTHTARCTIAHCKQCPAEQSARGCLQNGVRLGRFARIFYNAWKSTSVSPLLSQSRTLKPQLIQTMRCSKKGVIWRSRNSWSHVAPVPIHRGRVNAAARYVLLIAPLFCFLCFSTPLSGFAYTRAGGGHLRAVGTSRSELAVGPIAAAAAAVNPFAVAARVTGSFPWLSCEQRGRIYAYRHTSALLSTSLLYSVTDARRLFCGAAECPLAAGVLSL